jgi:dTDP-4-amino-4,6-dideoxy-D-galactose acyltransferase
MTMNSEVCRVLEWDSEFFGVRIARVTCDAISPALLPAIDTYSASQGIQCLYFLAAAHDAESSAAAQSGGFHFVDVRMTFERPLGTFSGQATPCVRPFRGQDLPALEAIARASHHDSRFYADPRFPRAACDRLYEAWISRSCSGWAKLVLVAEAAGEPAGYLTCHFDERGEGSIGLVAVSESRRGLGLGAQLVDAALQHFQSAGATRVTVVTQGRNIASQRLYQGRGFRTDAVQLWYHRWFHGSS